MPLLRFSNLVLRPDQYQAAPHQAVLAAVTPGVPGTTIATPTTTMVATAQTAQQTTATPNTPAVNTPAVIGDPVSGGSTITTQDTQTTDSGTDATVPFYQKWQTWAIAGGALLVLAVALYLIFKKKK